MSILSFDFMQRAFIAGIITALLASITGVFVVLRRMSLVGDALSHTALAGIAGAMLLGYYPFYGAMVSTVLAALLIEVIRNFFKKYAEIALAVVMSGGMGLAVVLISIGKSFNTDLVSYLFGSLVAIMPQDLTVIWGLGIVILTTVIFLYRELFAITFDEDAARLSGVNVGAINLYFTIIVALVIALCVRIVGALLISALMVIPAAVSLQLAQNFKQTFIISGVVALFSVIMGLYLAFVFDIAPGGTIVLLATGILMITLMIKGLRGNWR